MFQTASPIHRNLIFLTFLFCSAAAFAQVPAPPAGGTTLTRIEESTDWKTCGACGNTGGAGTMATFSMTRGITSPAKDGSSSQFQIGGPYPYSNGFWYIKHLDSPATPVTYLKYSFYLYVPADFATAPQGIEFQCQQKAAGRTYNFAWQANYKAHVWRIFDISTKHWVTSPIVFEGFTPGKWHHIIAEFHASGSEAVNDALTIDGVRHVVGMHHASIAATTGHSLSNAFQLDLDGHASPYEVYVDAMSLTYK